MLSKYFRYIRRKLQEFPFWLLKIFFGFDNWHVYASSRPKYVKVVWDIANSLKPRNKVVEIGCGLGNLLEGLKYESKIGIDIDQRVIRAARFIHSIRGSEIIFKNSDFEERYRAKDANLVVMVNWIHSIPAEELRKKINVIINNILSENGYLLCEGVSVYKYYHSKSFFEEFGEIKISHLVDGREIHLIKVRNKFVIPKS